VNTEAVAARPKTIRGNTRYRLAYPGGELSIQVTLLILAVVFTLPFWWMLSSSLKSDAEIFQIPPTLVPHTLQFSNYPESVTTINFFGYLLNTLRYTVFATIGAVLSNLVISYGFS